MKSWTYSELFDFCAIILLEVLFLVKFLHFFITAILYFVH